MAACFGRRHAGRKNKDQKQCQYLFHNQKIIALSRVIVKQKKVKFPGKSDDK
jgi:hypothetical protein